MIDTDFLLDFLTTKDEVVLFEALTLLIGYFLLLYDEEVEEFANDIDIQIDETFDQRRTDFGLYIESLLYDLRVQFENKKQELSEQNISGSEIAETLVLFVSQKSDVLTNTQTSNAKQLAQLHVVEEFKKTYPNASITKTWNAHSDCCEVCKALNGTTLSIDKPFLVNGQEVELANGKSHIYNYIDTLVCIAHPNDKCWISFNIEKGE